MVIILVFILRGLEFKFRPESSKSQDRPCCWEGQARGCETPQPAPMEAVHGMNCKMQGLEKGSEGSPSMQPNRSPGVMIMLEHANELWTFSLCVINEGNPIHNYCVHGLERDGEILRRVIENVIDGTELVWRKETIRRTRDIVFFLKQGRTRASSSS